jgi:hypothetical protein
MSTYLEFFGLKKPPFSMTPDPSFAFATKEHEQALSKMTFYVDERQGVFLLLGEVGTGKTTIAKLAVDNWKSQPEKYTVGQVGDPSLTTPAAFLRLVLSSFMQPVLRNYLDLTRPRSPFATGDTTPCSSTGRTPGERRPGRHRSPGPGGRAPGVQRPPTDSPSG